MNALYWTLITIGTMAIPFAISWVGYIYLDDSQRRSMGLPRRKK